MDSLAFLQVSEREPSVADAGVFSAADGIIFGAIFLLICSVAWLSNREIRISRASARKSEKLLETERDSLQRRIAERTTEFVQAEERRLIELRRNAEFGKLSQGLFHDLMSPLSSLSLYAEQSGSKQEIQGVIDATRRINSFMESVKRCIGKDEIAHEGADLAKEIDIAVDILSYKARMSGVDIVTDQKVQAHLDIHPVRLHQLLLNLISNGIDACVQERDMSGVENHLVTITTIRKESGIELSIADTGCGLSVADQARLFKDRFTTKKDGTGIGLMTIKNIVENDLKSTIKVKSDQGKGAEFIVSIPVTF